MAALKRDGSISCRASAWKTMAKPTAITVERKSVMTGGTRRAMRTPVKKGTSNSHGVMQNLCCKAPVNAATSVDCDPWQKKPATVKMMRVRTMDGTVVMSM